MTHPNESISAIVEDQRELGTMKMQCTELGLTKREYFAAMAMQGLLSNSSEFYDSIFIADKAVVCADKLIKELNEPV